MATWCKACDGRGLVCVWNGQELRQGSSCGACSGTGNAPAATDWVLRAVAQWADELAEADAPVVVGAEVGLWGVTSGDSDPSLLANLNSAMRDLERACEPPVAGCANVAGTPKPVSTDSSVVAAVLGIKFVPVTPPETKADLGKLAADIRGKIDELDAAGLNKPRSYRWGADTPPQGNIREMKLDPVIADWLAAAPVPTDARKEAYAAEAARLDAEWYGRTVYPVSMKPDPDLADAISNYFDAHIERLIAGQPIVPPPHKRQQCVLWIGDREVLNWVKLVGRPDPVYVCRPVLTGLPADAVLHSVRYDWKRRAFGFVLESVSFAPVPEGDVLPRYGGPFGVTYEAVKLSQVAPVKYPEACVKPYVPLAKWGGGDQLRQRTGWAVYAGPACDELLGTFPDQGLAELFLTAVRGD